MALLLYSLAAAAVSSAQPIWEPLNGPPGGIVTCLSTSPEGAVFAGISYPFGYNQQAGSICRSLDHGQTWSRLGNELLLAPEISSVPRTIAFSSSGTVYAAFAGNGVYRSTDGGDHWSAVNTGLPTSPYPLILNVRDIAVSPTGEVLCCPDNAGVYQLNAQGTGWAAANTGLGSTLITRSIVFTTVAGTTTTFVGVRGAGVFKRTGGGAWVAASTGLGSVNINKLHTGMVNASLTMFACTDSGLYSSTTNGATWVSVGGPFSGSVVTACQTLASAIVVTAQAPGAIFRSTDGGVQWVASGAGFNGLIARALAPDGAGGGGVVVGSTEGGICRSTNGGASWTESNTGMNAQSVLRLLVAANGTIFAGTPTAGVIRSTNGGATWDSPRLLGRRIFALAQAPWGSSGGDLFCGNYNITTAGVSDGHAYHSTDNGASWTPLDSGLRAAMVSGFAFPGPVGQVFCSAAWNAGTVLQVNAIGAAWAPLASPPNVPAYFLGRAPNGDLYIGTEGVGVWRLPASPPGSAWQNKGFTQSQQFAVAFNSQGHIFFGNDGYLRGVYRSTDNGASFQPLDSYPSLFGHALLIAPDDTIYAAGRDAGIQRSTDNGNTWQSFSSGFTSTSCHSLSLGPDGHLYAGIAGRGVYRTINPIVAPPCAADFNGDGGVDGADVEAFFMAWEAAEPSADVNADGGIDGGDVEFFFGRWEAGC